MLKHISDKDIVKRETIWINKDTEANKQPTS